MELNNEQEDVEVFDEIYNNETYRVNVVRLPDMFFDTYAVINKQYSVIEQIHPNLFNVKKIADQFDKWLRLGITDEENMYEAFEAFATPGKSN